VSVWGYHTPNFGDLTTVLTSSLSLISVIFWEGAKQNGWVGFSHALQLNLWPESLSAASTWFGVVVFGYGVVPFILSFRHSMENREQIQTATKIGLSITYMGYLFASDG
jgi:amino acid permease